MVVNDMNLYPSETYCNEEKMSNLCFVSTTGKIESFCKDGIDSYGEEETRDPCVSACSKSCCDDEKDSCNEETLCSPCPSASAKQPSDEAAECFQSKCCFLRAF